MRALPFRLRIALLSSVISGIVLVGFGAVAFLFMARQKLALVDTEIRSLAVRHPGWLTGQGDPGRIVGALESGLGDSREASVLFLVKNVQGRTAFTSTNWPADLDPEQIESNLADDPHAGLASAMPGRRLGLGPGPMAGPGSGRGPGGGGRNLGPGRGGPQPAVFTKIPRFQTVEAGDTTWRLGVFGNAELTLVVGLDYAPARAELARVRNLFLLLLPAALGLIGAGGWLVANRALRPLEDIARLAERVTARGLDQRIPPSTDTSEIARLGQVINRMMDRLETSFHQATRFTADASHELRTPLAVMQGELENALRNAEPGSSQQQTCANLLEETQRLKRIIGSLLLLAQADTGQLPLAREPVDLTVALADWVEDIETLAAESRLELRQHLAPGILVSADPALLRQAVLNLMHNALRYNEAGGWIDLTLTTHAGQARLQVTNAGPGIPQTDQPRLFERFFRADASRSRRVDGVGLGLSLAREIARAHGGDLVLEESRPGRTGFTLLLPLDPGLPPAAHA